MIYVFILTICVPAAIIYFQTAKSRRLTSIHEKEMDDMKRAILRLQTASQENGRQLQLSDEWFGKLNRDRAGLSREISVMVHELVRTLSDNNLLK